MSQTDLTVQSAKIYAYRIFDIGDEIDLAKSAAILDQKSAVSRHQLRKLRRSLIISESPVVITLAEKECRFKGQVYRIKQLAKLWTFGTLSLQMSIDLTDKVKLSHLAELGYFIENDAEFHQLAHSSMQELCALIYPAIHQHQIWNDYEDYLVYVIGEGSDLDPAKPSTFINDHITAMIFAEKPMAFAPSVNQSLEQHMHQYGADDLVMLHWNGAVIYDPEDFEDIADIIEFALCQLLELRYYDDLLDTQLASLYQELEQKRKTVWRNPYTHISDQAALQYIELSEIVDKVGNAFKITGDFYYATIFRAAAQKFHILDWRNSVAEKLQNLAEVSKLFQGDVNERRNQIMEAIIIALIAIEVVPLLYNLAQHLIKG